MARKLILVFAIASGAVSCSSLESDTATGDVVHRQLVALVRRGAGAEARLESIIPGDWTALYVFGPYTRADVIQRCAGGRVESHRLDVREDVNLVVLVREGSRRSLDDATDECGFRT